MKNLIILVIVMSVFLIHGQTIVRWTTNMGEMTAELREDLVPVTAYNFRNLSSAGFYDGVIFHRVIADFMIQDGDPTGTGYGGPGYNIPDEFHPELTHVRGVLSMANTGNPNTGGSQYFITVVPTHWLDNAHAVFGYVFDGMEVADAISEVPTDSNNRPIDPVIIDSIRVLTPPVESFLPESTRNVVEMGHVEVFLMNCSDYSVQYEWYINEEQQTETGSIFTCNFSQGGDFNVMCRVTGDYEYDYELVWQYEVINNAVLGDEIEPGNSLNCYPNPFNPRTTVTYNAQESGNLKLLIYNLKGQIVAVLENGYKERGLHQAVWEAEEAASGVYLVRYESESGRYTRKILLMK
jgi:cyclophilin family peptidyl-prolyl cis-trans isomerase